MFLLLRDNYSEYFMYFSLSMITHIIFFPNLNFAILQQAFIMICSIVFTHITNIHLRVLLTRY